MNHKLEMDMYRNEINLYRGEIQNLTKKLKNWKKDGFNAKNCIEYIFKLIL